MFQTSLSTIELRDYVWNQLDRLYPDNRLAKNEQRFLQSVRQALDRVEYCFRHVSLKSYHQEGATFFSHLHSDQYTMFLWFLSNSAWKEFDDTEVASKLFYLNKTLNSVVCMYDADMPDIFLIIHGGGIVLGKAAYSDFFVCYQGCTVGAIKGVYPTLGRGVAMSPQSSIIGDCLIGDHVTIGNQVLVRNLSLPSQSRYFRHTETGRHVLQQADKPWAQSFFNVPIPYSNGEQR